MRKMKSMILLHVCTLFAYSIAIENCDSLKLELVQVLFRHGARTPVKKGLDLFNVKNYSRGFKELTEDGRRQEYNFGKFLRRRYDHYLDSTYNSKDVYGYSVDTSRTKISLQLLLAGLYPRTKWNSVLDWNPFPYSYAPGRLDILLSAYRNPKFLDVFVKIILSNEFKTKISKFSKLFDLVVKNTNSKRSVIHLIAVFDVLISKEYMNLPLPYWYTPKVRQQFIEIMGLMWDAVTATTEIKKLAIGSLIKTFVENMNLNGTIDNPRQIYLYSGHDLNIAMFTRSHGIQQFPYPFFGSALIFEKLRDSRNQVYVRLFAWDGLSKLQNLQFDSRMKCYPVENYLEIVKPIIPTEKELDEMIGSFSAKEIKDLYFNSAYKPSEPFESLFDE